MIAEPSAKQVLDAVHEVDDKATQLLADAVSREHLSQAVADGIRAAVSDPALWAAAGVAMRRRAQEEAGGLLFGGLKVVASRIAWVLMIGAAVYYLGGWVALSAWLKSGGHQ